MEYQAAEVNGPPPEILVVDDTPDNLRLLVAMLAEHGYRARPAPSGSHALATVKKKVPDLILLDILMPDLDGYSVCRRLKADERTRHIPVIFLSALGELQDKIEAFAAGGIDFITKPFQEGEVLVRVETHLKIRELQRRLNAEVTRFKILAEASFESVLIHVDGRIVDANPQAADLFRCAGSDLVGRDPTTLMPDEVRHHLLSSVEASFECDILCGDSEQVPVEIRTRSHPLTGQQVVAIRDLSARKKLEREMNQLAGENSALKAGLQDRFRFGDIIGRSQPMQNVYALISRAATSPYSVIVAGESGTGKELVARTIHRLGGRGKGPFVTVNCGAVAESLFEREFFGHKKGAFTDALRDEPGYFDAARGGTLFLDEIGEMAPAMQVKLLRVLESGEYFPVGDVRSRTADTRIIAATNRDLADMVRRGMFREDLYYRIHVIEIVLPPLRERREDIHLLAEHILAGCGGGAGLADLPPQFMDMLRRYDWPGNVRELTNAIHRFLATGAVSLPGYPQQEHPAPPGRGGLPEAVGSLESRMIEDALKKTLGHRGDASRLLQIPRRSLQRKMLKYRLRPERDPST